MHSTQEELWVPKWAPSIVDDEVPDFDWDYFLTHDEQTQDMEIRGIISVTPMRPIKLSPYWDKVFEEVKQESMIKKWWPRLSWWQKLKYTLGFPVVVEDE